jgi:hypothetical protein
MKDPAKVLNLVQRAIDQRKTTKEFVAELVGVNLRTMNRWLKAARDDEPLPSKNWGEIVPILEGHVGQCGMLNVQSFEQSLQEQFRNDALNSLLCIPLCELIDQMNDHLTFAEKSVATLANDKQRNSYGADRTMDDIRENRKYCFRKSVDDYYSSRFKRSELQSADGLSQFLEATRESAEVLRKLQIDVSISGTSPLAAVSLKFIRDFYRLSGLRWNVSNLTTSASRSTRKLKPDFIFAGCVTMLLNLTKETRNYRLGHAMYSISQDVAMHAIDDWRQEKEIEVAFIRNSTGMINCFRFQQQFDGIVKPVPFSRVDAFHDYIQTCFANTSSYLKWGTEAPAESLGREEAAFYDLLWFAFCFLFNERPVEGVFEDFYAKEVEFRTAAQRAMGHRLQ